jgi:hypothetical protein
MSSMMRLSGRFRLGSVAVVVVAGALGALAGTAQAATAVPASSCSPKPYAYAGLVSNVAGWIGVGSPKAGPGHRAEWLQVGLSSQAGIGSELYAEITQPGRPIRYLTLASGIAPGSSFHLAVVGLPGKADVWHVLVNGKAATGPINLPGSKAFQPMAMGESWSGGPAHCNGYRYRFDQLRVTTNGWWKALVSGAVISDNGYRVVDRTKAGFTAVSG